MYVRGDVDSCVMDMVMRRLAGSRRARGRAAALGPGLLRAPVCEQLGCGSADGVANGPAAPPRLLPLLEADAAGGWAGEGGDDLADETVDLPIELIDGCRSSRARLLSHLLGRSFGARAPSNEVRHEATSEALRARGVGRTAVSWSEGSMA